MKPLPRIALSVRQPWAWLLANGWKNIENRSWPTSFRGDFLIHAAKGCTRAEYEAALVFMSAFCDPARDLRVPAFADLERGGIVGVATLLDCVTSHPSEWFCGDFGFVVSNSRPLPFVPQKGALNFFPAWYPDDAEGAAT